MWRVAPSCWNHVFLLKPKRNLHCLCGKVVHQRCTTSFLFEQVRTIPRDEIAAQRVTFEELCDLSSFSYGFVSFKYLYCNLFAWPLRWRRAASEKKLWTIKIDQFVINEVGSLRWFRWVQFLFKQYLVCVEV